MTHAIHQTPRRIFGDDCDECVERASSIPRMLSGLDSSNKRTLGALAAELHTRAKNGDLSKPDNVSWADLKAVENLRFAARLVFASGITEEVAQG